MSLNRKQRRRAVRKEILTWRKMRTAVPGAEGYKEKVTLRCVCNRLVSLADVREIGKHLRCRFCAPDGQVIPCPKCGMPTEVILWRDDLPHCWCCMREEEYDGEQAIPEYLQGLREGDQAVRSGPGGSPQL